MCSRSDSTCAAIVFIFISVTRLESRECDVRARTDAGWVCGSRRVAEDDSPYASFRGVPYAKQPLGELRFKELQPTEPWDDVLDATVEGPVCPQRDLFYGPIMKPLSMSEACINANVHAPLHALPNGTNARTAGLPIIVYVHGGVFSFGSGDTDLYGPEYMVSQDVIVITFNYRLGPFGFLWLNTTRVPGNNGLRDMITLLRWVRRNAKNFGGDPNEVTFAGHSAGGACVHLLSLCSSVGGLFKRILLMSGPSTRSLYSTAPAYSRETANQFLTYLQINSTDPEEIHKQLIKMPLQTIMDANDRLQDQYGITTFSPVVESPLPGVTTIIDDDPEILIAKDRGANYTLIIGYCTAECESFRPRFEAINMVERITNDSSQLLSPNMLYAMTKEEAQKAGEKIKKRYFKSTVNMKEYVKMCSDNFIVYPSLKLAEWREAGGGAPVHLYQFAYEGQYSVMKAATGLEYNGTAHGEDLTYIFRVNSMLSGRRSSMIYGRDQSMKVWMTTLVTQFITCNKCECQRSNEDRWPPAGPRLQYLNIRSPKRSCVVTPTEEQKSFVQFFDSLRTKPRESESLV